jgi:hypothetical protein
MDQTRSHAREYGYSPLVRLRRSPYSTAGGLAGNAVAMPALCSSRPVSSSNILRMDVAPLGFATNAANISALEYAERNGATRNFLPRRTGIAEPLIYRTFVASCRALNVTPPLALGIDRSSCSKFLTELLSPQRLETVPVPKKKIDFESLIAAAIAAVGHPAVQEAAKTEAKPEIMDRPQAVGRK